MEQISFGFFKVKLNVKARYFFVDFEHLLFLMQNLARAPVSFASKQWSSLSFFLVDASLRSKSYEEQ